MVCGFWNVGKYFLIGLILFWRIQKFIACFLLGLHTDFRVRIPQLKSENLQVRHSPGKDIINSNISPEKLVIKTISTCSEAFYFPNLNGLTINQAINVKIN